jgi:hypothetical protein
MAAEQESSLPITRIALDLEQRSLTVSHHERVLARVTLAREGLIFQSPTANAAPEEMAQPIVDAPAVLPAAVQEQREKEAAVTLEGKLKTKPVNGRPDRSGKPTVVARFAAHVENEEQAHMYFATFHRHTAGLALGLDANVPLTVQGYTHPTSNPEERLDTLSVIHLLDYPGKPQGK